MIYSKNDIILCPHCGAEQEAPPTDYVLYNIEGGVYPGKDDCDSCGKRFVVTPLDDDTYSVEVCNPDEVG
jgi:hypothetical protein